MLIARLLVGIPPGHRRFSFSPKSRLNSTSRVLGGINVSPEIVHTTSFGGDVMPSVPGDLV